MSNRYTYVDSSNYNPVAGWIVGCQIGIHMLILVTTTCSRLDSRMSNKYTYVDSSNYNPVAGWIVGCQISIHMLMLVSTTL